MMNVSRRPYRIFGLGNALVDKIALVSDSLLEEFSLSRGLMTLAEHDMQKALLQSLQAKKLIRDQKPGGSVANTLFTSACLVDQPSVFIGKTAKDELGEFYRGEMEKKKIRMPLLLAPIDQGMTGTSIVMTTPDGQRTMLTHLGVNECLSKSDLENGLSLLKEAEFCYLEGYLWTNPEHRKLAGEVFQKARMFGIPVAFSLSDPGITRGFLRDSWEKDIEEYVDILFGNEEEALALTGANNARAALQDLTNKNTCVFLTLGAEGCMMGHPNGFVHKIPGRNVSVLDTTGAGDAFAGGVLATLDAEIFWHTDSQKKTKFAEAQKLGADSKLDALHKVNHAMTEAAIVGNFVASEVVRIHGSRIVQEYSPTQILQAQGTR